MRMASPHCRIIVYPIKLPKFLFLAHGLFMFAKLRLMWQRRSNAKRFSLGNLHQSSLQKEVTRPPDSIKIIGPHCWVVNLISWSVEYREGAFIRRHRRGERSDALLSSSSTQKARFLFFQTALRGIQPPKCNGMKRDWTKKESDVIMRSLR